ncbi:hypothetical protein CUJ89_34625 [Burkholderia pyrrocinia]|uniref:Uncharacterized protein n=1 Tax=Burkholderia pyrrocinia TaxID=60550 RepID=A0A2Z5N7Q6_BURPY|nr:hypothetical protein CUJ89_34625 [Burkholderia pyrrocinia]
MVDLGARAGPAANGGTAFGPVCGRRRADEHLACPVASFMASIAFGASCGHALAFRVDPQRQLAAVRSGNGERSGKGGKDGNGES